MSKKLLTFLAVALSIVAVVVTVIICASPKEQQSDECKFLTDGDWVHYDENIGENLIISFNEDYNYYYHCECGEPVGASDVLERFSYNKKKQQINLYGCDGEKAQIDVIYADNDSLCLKIDGEALTFKNRDSKLEVSLRECAEEYVKEGALPLTVLSFEKGKITLAPYNYDGDARDSFADYIFTLDTTDDISFVSVSVKEERGEETMEVYELTKEDHQYVGEYYTGGFVEINGEGKVSSVVFYGELIIW